MIDTRSFQNAKILVIGDVMLDRYWWGNVTRISPEAPVPVVNHNRSTAVPGGAANVAVNIAKLGAQVKLVGVVGMDEEASQLRAALSDHCVGADDMVAVEGRTTSVKTRIVAHGQQIARIDRETTEHLDDAIAEKVLSKAIPLLDGSEVILISDYAKGCLCPTVLSKIIETGRSLGKKMIVDPKGTDYQRYNGAFMITPNRREAAQASGLDESTDSISSVAGARLLDILDIQNLLITESEDGMTLFSRDHSPVHFDAATHEVYDVTGAGDTVIATTAIGVAIGLPTADAVRIANIAAGIAVGQIGTSAVSQEQLQSMLKTDELSAAI